MAAGPAARNPPVRDVDVEAGSYGELEPLVVDRSHEALPRRLWCDLLAAATLLAVPTLVATAVIIAVANPPTTVCGRIMAEAARSGVAGGLSMLVNVFFFMPMRTAVNYQQATGVRTAASVVHALYAEGGISRFYRGVLVAVIQGPLSRFGDTAANAGMMALMRQGHGNGAAEVMSATLLATVASGGWRMLITPVDTVKTVLQVTGRSGFSQLRSKVSVNGLCVLWDGAYAAAVASVIGYYPWFFAYNALNDLLPVAVNGSLRSYLRDALMGMCASVLSDSCSNAARVVKVVKQTHPVRVSYMQAAMVVVRMDGCMGLVLRGLSIKILTNAVQAVVFTIVWRCLRDALGTRWGVRAPPIARRSAARPFRRYGPT